MRAVFVDTEFTSLLYPELLSIGLVTVDGRECYAELDLKSEVGLLRYAATPWDVREGVIEDKWGLFPHSVCDSDWSLGRRAGEWLLHVAESDSDSKSPGRIELLYDYSADFELLVGALEGCNLWASVRQVVRERNVAGHTGRIGPELAAEQTYRRLRGRTPPLHRHHALADAWALRAAWQMSQLLTQRPVDFARLLSICGTQSEAWLYEWLAKPALALDRQIPLDLLEHEGGIETVAAALTRVQYGCA